MAKQLLCSHTAEYNQEQEKKVLIHATNWINAQNMLHALLTKTIWYWHTNRQADWEQNKVQQQLQVYIEIYQISYDKGGISI